MSRQENNNLSSAKTGLGVVGLKEIPFLSKPLSQGGVLSYLTPSEYKDKFGCEYTEDIIFTEKIIENFKKHWDFEITSQYYGLYHQDLKQKILYRLQYPMKQLAVYLAGPEVGYGVMAIDDISEGTVLCLYAGEVYDDSSRRDAEYGFLLHCRDMETNISVSAKHRRGMAGFMSHLPLDREVEKAFLEKRCQDPQERETLLRAYPKLARSENFPEALAEHIYQKNGSVEFDELKFETKKLVAAANVTARKIYINNRPAMAMIAIRSIKKGEPVGYCYGKGYWNGTNRKPLLLAKDGTLFSPAPLSWYSGTFFRNPPHHQSVQEYLANGLRQLSKL